MKTKRSQAIYAQRRTTVRLLLFINAALWGVLSVSTPIEMLLDSNGFPTALAGFLLLFNATVMFILGKTLAKWGKLAYRIAVAVVLLNAALAFTGLPDLLYTSAFFVDVLILLGLFSLRGYYGR